jgi:hypothetical protein
VRKRPVGHGAAPPRGAWGSRVHKPVAQVAENLDTPERDTEQGGNALETTRIEELLERLVDQNAEMFDKISDLLQELQDIKTEIIATNAEVLQSLFKIKQSVGKA